MADKTITKVYDLLVEVKSLVKTEASEYIDMNQASDYLKLKKSYIYNLVYKNKIPFYKPNGKKLYFNKLELSDWISQSRIKTQDEFNNESSKNDKNNKTNALFSGRKRIIRQKKVLNAN